MGKWMVNPFLSEEHELVRRSVVEFGERFVSALARKIDQEDWYPRELLRELGKMGLLTPMVPPDYGGAGLDLRGEVVVVEELSRFSASVGFIAEIVGTNVAHALLKYGNKAHREELLPKVAGGELVPSYALTEPCCGSDAAAIETRAERRGGEWFINGRKIYITQGAYADIYLVFARTGPREDRHKSITAFLVKRSNCVEVTKLDMMGMRGTGTAEVRFNECPVGDDDVLGKLNDGFRVAMYTLNVARVGISAVALGIARAVIDEALGWVRDRVAFGKPLMEWEWVQFQLADIFTKAQLGRSITYEAAWRFDHGDRDFVTYASMAKLYTAQMAVEVARVGVQLLGGYGYSKESLSERAYRDSKVLEIAEGTNEVQRMIIFKSMIKGPPPPGP